MKIILKQDVKGKGKKGYFMKQQIICCSSEESQS